MAQSQCTHALIVHVRWVGSRKSFFKALSKPKKLKMVFDSFFVLFRQALVLGQTQFFHQFDDGFEFLPSFCVSLC